MITLQSKLFTKTRKEVPKDEVSVNAQLLTRAGFVDKVTAGVYAYLPLGLRVLERIKQCVREEMDALGAFEILMPALTPKELWTTTDRWDSLDVLFRFEGSEGKEYALGATHEEVVTPLIKKFVQSYKDLPLAVYQIQDKFRNEPRAKSGLLRGREFSMKDMYSFHASVDDLDIFYQKAIVAYTRVFSRCGLDAKIVEASGGAFSPASHEFQVFTPNGEDTVFACAACGVYKNKEIVTSASCDHCGGAYVEHKAIEVGNIFRLGSRFSDAFAFAVADENGKRAPVAMGCYGIGPSRLMGAIVEVHHDEHGIRWPESVAPYAAHVIALSSDGNVLRKAQEVARTLSDHDVEVLLDDRDARAGEKFAESDLIGVPSRIVVSEKLVAAGQLELKQRTELQSVVLPESDIYARFMK